VHVPCRPSRKIGRGLPADAWHQRDTRCIRGWALESAPAAAGKSAGANGENPLATITSPGRSHCRRFPGDVQMKHDRWTGCGRICPPDTGDVAAGRGKLLDLAASLFTAIRKFGTQLAPISGTMGYGFSCGGRPPRSSIRSGRCFVFAGRRPIS